MIILDVFLIYLFDEEYFGEKFELVWEEDVVINAVFEKF